MWQGVIIAKMAGQSGFENGAFHYSFTSAVIPGLDPGMTFDFEMEME